MYSIIYILILHNLWTANEEGSRDLPSMILGPLTQSYWKAWMLSKLLLAFFFLPGDLTNILDSRLAVVPKEVYSPDIDYLDAHIGPTKHSPFSLKSWGACSTKIHNIGVYDEGGLLVMVCMETVLSCLPSFLTGQSNTVDFFK